MGPWAFRGIAQAHLVAGTVRRVRRPVLFGMLVFKETVTPSRDLEMFCGCVSCLRYLLVVRTDELFAADSEVVHAVRCLARGDAAFTPTAHRWETREGNRPDKVAVRS